METGFEKARELASSLCARYAERSVSAIAECCGIRLEKQSWQVADGKLIFLAECSLRPPVIRLNQTAITKIADQARTRQLPGEKEQREWFTAERITEVVIAHELYHVLAQEPSAPAAEAAAHVFAQQLLGLPFSPSLYETLLIADD